LISCIASSLFTTEIHGSGKAAKKTKINGTRIARILTDQTKEASPGIRTPLTILA